MDGRLTYIKAEDVLQIPVGAKHAVKAITPLEIVEVKWGKKLQEEDIIRIAVSWEEKVKHIIKNRKRWSLSSALQYVRTMWKTCLKTILFKDITSQPLRRDDS